MKIITNPVWWLILLHRGRCVARTPGYLHIRMALGSLCSRSSTHACLLSQLKNSWPLQKNNSVDTSSKVYFKHFTSITAYQCLKASLWMTAPSYAITVKGTDTQGRLIQENWIPCHVLNINSASGTAMFMLRSRSVTSCEQGNDILNL